MQSSASDSFANQLWANFNQPMSIRPLQQILIGEPALAEFVKRRQREANLELHVRQALPVLLSRHVRVVEAVASDLELVAASGAAAGLVRQRAPQILRVLEGKGWKFTAIRVRVQAVQTAAPAEKPAAKQLDSATAARLMALAASISDARLCEALRSLADHSSHGDKPFQRIKDQHAGKKEDRVLDDLGDEQ
jgi:hypothetical protein